MELNKYSRTLTQDVTQPAAQAMLYAIGFTDEDFNKAQVGIVSMGWDGNPCNMHLNDLALSVKKSVNATEGLLGLRFYTIGVSDGISMGTDGMRYSLVSRDIIADSIERYRSTFLPGGRRMWWNVHSKYNVKRYRSLGYEFALFIFQSSIE